VKDGDGVPGARLLFVGGMDLALDAGGACRCGPGEVCRNSFAGLVMLLGLELLASLRALSGTRPGSKRCLAQSNSRQPSPGPRRPAWGDVDGL